MVDAEAEWAARRMVCSHFRVTGGCLLFYLAGASASALCVISYILLPVQRVACESGASVLGLVGTAMFPAAQGEVHGTQLQPCVMHESPSETQTGPFGVGGRK